MKIPDKTTKSKYYVAISEQEAFSSWDTLDNAIQSYNKLHSYFPEDAKRVIGIIEVTESVTDKILIKI